VLNRRQAGEGHGELSFIVREFLDAAPSGGWVENQLTETPDTDPCTQAPVSWRNTTNRPSGLFSDRREFGLRQIATVASSVKLESTRFDDAGGKRQARAL